MTNEENEVKELLDRFGFWLLQIKLNNANYLYDSNKFAEPLSLKLLNLLYDLDLADLNEEKANAPGVDLVDKASGVAFQISSRTDNNKVIATLRTAVVKKFADDYPNGIRFFVLSEGKFDFKKIKPTSILASFNEKRDIVYPDDVAKQIKRIYENDPIKFGRLKELLRKEIIYPEPLPTPAPDISALLRLVQQQLEQASRIPVPALTVEALYEADLSLPELFVASQRSETVDGLTTALNQHSALWVWGSVDTGKSTLAYLVAKRWEAALWLDLRGLKAENLYRKAVSILALYLDVSLTKDGKANLMAIAEKLPPKSLLVINDLPDFAGANKAKQEFLYLCQQLNQYGTTLLVTSNHPPYSEFAAALSAQLSMITAPPVTENEVAEVLRTYGAAEEFITANKVMITVMTDGHAFLVHTAALYLKEHDWNITDDVFTSLFTHQYGDAYSADVYAKILASTQDEETHSLLYRTAVIRGAFSDNEIGVVGSVNPAVPHVHQRAQGLKGLWFQEVAKGNYQLSPLVKQLGGNLSDALQNEINQALGDAITRKSMLSQIEAYDALIYYRRGKAYIKLSWVLIRVLEFSLINPALFFDWGFGFFWYRSPLPNEVPSFFKSLIRVLQIQLVDGRDEELAFLISDLEKILATEDVGDISRSYAELMISHVFLKTNPVKSFRYFLSARANWQQVQEALPSDSQSKIDLDDFFWTSFYSLRNKEDFEGWFALLKTAGALPDSEHLDNMAPYVVAAHSLVHLTVLPDGSDPAKAIDTLQTVFDLAVDTGLDLIAVYALRYLVTIYGIYIKQFDEAASLLNQHKELISSKPVYAFLVKEEYGRQLFFAGQTKEALYTLSEIIDTKIEKPFMDGVEGLRVFSQMTGETDAKVADHYIEKALSKAENDPFFPELGRLKIAGEASISLWLLGKRIEAIRLLSEAYDRLLKIFQEAEDHQGLLIRLAHVANYIRGEIIDGRPPTKSADGGDYAVPVRGLFYRDNGPLLASGFYFEERKFIGSTVFEDVYEFIGDYTNARKWALLGIELSLSLPEAKFFPVLYKSLQYIVMDRQHRKATNLFRFVEEKLAQIRKLNAEGKDVGDFAQIRHLLAEEHGDSFFFAQVIIPTVLTIAHDIVRNRIGENDYRALIENLFSAWQPAIRQPEGFQFLRNLFKNILINRISFTNLQTMLNEYEGSDRAQLATVAHILQSAFADAKEAALLQLPIAAQLDLYQQLAPALYRFEIVPFLERFWITKFNEYRRQVHGWDFWQTNSLPRLQNSALTRKVKATFQAVVHHTEVPLSPTVESWLYG